jgi:hypothetical protein
LTAFCGKGLTNRSLFSIDDYSDNPPLLIALHGNLSVFHLGMAVGAKHQQILGMVSCFGVNMVHLKIRLAISFAESEATNLAAPSVNHLQKGAQTHGHPFIAFSWRDGDAFASLDLLGESCQHLVADPSP